MMSMDSLSLKSLEQQFEELCSIINYHRGRASQAVNEQQLLTAWNVGAYVSQKLKTNEWGSKVVTQFVEYMRTHVPEQKGFGRANIYNMVMLYEEYSSPVFLSLIGKYVPSVIVQSKIGQLESVDSTTASDALKTAQSATPQMGVCRNERCTFFFSSITKEKFEIFKQRYFEDFFDLCVPCI